MPEEFQEDMDRMTSMVRPLDKEALVGLLQSPSPALRAAAIKRLGDMCEEDLTYQALADKPREELALLAKDGPLETTRSAAMRILKELQ